MSHPKRPRDPNQLASNWPATRAPSFGESIDPAPVRTSGALNTPQDQHTAARAMPRGPCGTAISDALADRQQHLRKRCGSPLVR
jgi:hypothetical protein